MKKQRIWGYPWPCLCLVFITLLFSCVVRHRSEPVIPVINEYNWEVKAWLKAGEISWNIPVNDSRIIVPYAIKKSTNGNQVDIMVVNYRLNSMEQMLFLKQKLLESDMPKI